MITPAAQAAPAANRRPEGEGGGLQRPRIAVALCLFELAMFAAFAILYLSPFTPPAVSASADGAATAVFVLPFIALAIAGGLIASRRPQNPIGWLMLAGSGLIVAGSLFSLIGSVLAASHSGAGRWVLLGGAVWAGGASVATFPFALAIMLFPDGSLPSPRWRWLVAAEVAVVALNLFVVVVTPGSGVLGIGFSNDPRIDTSSPLGVAALGGFANAAVTPLSIAQYAVQFAALVSVFLRIRGADSERRHQIKWFASGAAVTVVLIAIVSSIPVPGNAAPYAGLFIGMTVVGVLAIPVSISVAILKYRLYDIDIIISRTLVYGSLAVLITGVYVGVAVGIGELVGSGGRPNLGLSILATAIVAVGFQPARERLQRLANRLVYGRRATPYQVLSEFSSHVAGSYAADEVLPRMARVLQDGTGAEIARVWLRSDGQLNAAASWPSDDATVIPVAMADGALPPLPAVTRAVEVRHQGELLGALTVTKRRGESLTPVEEKLLEDLAHQAGLVLKNVGLTADLQRRLEELRASRQRLVSAQDAERRRLERNLHDGAQQHLVALKVKLGLAEMLAARDPEKAKATLQQLKGDTDEALETLRDLARGIYPPLLAEKGLVTALESQARKATLPVVVEGEGVGRYPQEVESTVYFCVLEALQNVQKYAGASRVTVRLRDVDGELRFDVEDDGRGFDVGHAKKGSGLTNMQDRVDAIGGRLAVRSNPGAGTCVSGFLPAGSLVAAGA